MSILQTGSTLGGDGLTQVVYGCDGCEARTGDPYTCFALVTRPDFGDEWDNSEVEGWVFVDSEEGSGSYCPDCAEKFAESPLDVTGRPTAAEPLADRVALAIVERGPCSGSELALVLGVRKESVLRVLRSASRFERVGGGRALAWRLAGTEREPLHDDGSLDRNQGVAAGLAELERRLAVVEGAVAATNGACEL